jgi:hypothetical protein
MSVTADGDVWVLEGTDEVELPSKGDVIVEGVKTGFDRIRIEWSANVEAAA